MGLAVGIGAALGAGYLSQAQSPNDPSAFSIVIIIIFTAPGGLIAGVILGCFYGWWSESRSDRSPKPQKAPREQARELTEMDLL